MNLFVPIFCKLPTISNNMSMGLHNVFTLYILIEHLRIFKLKINWFLKKFYFRSIASTMKSHSLEMGPSDWYNHFASWMDPK